MDPELVSTAATTVVKLLPTAVWEQAWTAVGESWRRVHPERAETAQADLTEMLATRQTGDEQALVEEWRSRLRRLAAADPQTADELRRVVAELHPLLPDATPQSTTITMQAKMSGNSRVNQAGHDLHVTER